MSVSKVARWFISPQNQSPLCGNFQDGLIGVAEITKDGINFDKWHAMQMFADITGLNNYTFDKKSYSNRELFSRIMPKINLTNKQPSIYKEAYAPLLKYNPIDTKVNIVRGELKSGIIDSATSGQGVAGSIYHIIASEYGNDVALDTIYNYQQFVHKFFLYHGFTVGCKDINISEEAMAEVKRRLATMISESRKITQRLNNGKLIAPLGTTLYQHYENEQLNALTAGDDFVNPIFADIDLNTNMIARLILTGSKGKIPNFVAINGSIGLQTINGKRFGSQAGWGRTSPYFVRYDTDPAASGFVSTSYREGVTSDVYAFMAGEARHGLISNALSTSITGYQNRISIKNLETIIVDNLRKSTKGLNVVQPLYAECGLDPAKTEKVKFPTVMLSDKDFKEKFKADIKKCDKPFQTKDNAKLLEEEFTQLQVDRDEFRKINRILEDHNPREYIMSDSKQLPVNVYRIIEDVGFNYNDMVEALDKKAKVLDPAYAIHLVDDLCKNIGYVYLNELQQKLKRDIPKHIVTSTKLMQMLIRSYLCISNLIDKKINNALLDIIVLRIITTYKKSLVDSGMSVGILAAQCISEPMTQFVLDSKHRSGAFGGTKTNEIVRIQELLGAKDTKTMKNPHMLIMVKPEYENDKLKVQEIANHIEMMTFNRFISATHIFFEEYAKPTHPNYTHEGKLIYEIAKHNYGQKIPNDLAKMCIRFEINKEELILKSMKLETIIMAIRRAHPEVFLVYTPENADNVFIRCYPCSSKFKPTQNFFEDHMLPLAKAIKEVIVRGVRDLIATNVIDVVKSVNKDDGSIETKKVFGIFAEGTNITDLLSNSYIDPYRTQSDSIEEMERVFGIVAARNKIINELVATLKKLNKSHCGIFADEMCYSGHVTSIQKTGLQKREMANITLRLSFQTPVQVIQNAAINGLVDRIGGVSGPLILGTNPNTGTTYNQIVVNEQFIQENAEHLDDVLAEL